MEVKQSDRQKLLSEKGQTVVEYILLFSVAISLVLTFYKSEAYRRLFGEQGQIGVKIKSQNEFAYRHAYTRNRPDKDIPRENRDGSIHPSYAEPGVGTRFFGPNDAYGD